MTTEQQTSTEDKFFGITTTIEEDTDAPDDKDKAVETEIEIIDDRLPEDRREPAAKADADKDNDEDEFESYSKKVQKRIKKLTWTANEERRKRESAERMNEEAVRVAQQLAARNQHNEDIIANGEGRLVNEFKGRAALAVQNARASYTKAHDEGDTDAVIKAQEDMIAAGSEWRDAVNYEADYQQRAQNYAAQHQAVQSPVQQPVQRPVAAKPTEEANKWSSDNPWFGANEHRDMTAIAYAEHERLVRDEGMTPDSDEYYAAIDKTVRKRFPEYFEDEDTGHEDNQPNIVVAPATRNNGARPRKLKLTATQAALAKRLGLTLEQYAEQMIKDMEHG